MPTFVDWISFSGEKVIVGTCFWDLWEESKSWFDNSDAWFKAFVRRPRAGVNMDSRLKVLSISTMSGSSYSESSLSTSCLKIAARLAIIVSSRILCDGDGHNTLIGDLLAKFFLGDIRFIDFLISLSFFRS